MPNRPPAHRPAPQPDARPVKAERKTACKRGYDRQWRKARLSHLAQHPLCVDCASRGLTTGATVVDHVDPHRGDREKFWDATQWQSLCKPCHDRKTARGQ